MIQITPQMRVLVGVDPVDFRKGIDGLARVAKETLQRDPFSGWVFIFRNRRKTAVKVLVYDGQGFWLCHKRLSQGRFRHWPESGQHKGKILDAPATHVLLSAGDFEATEGAPAWRRVEEYRCCKARCIGGTPQHQIRGVAQIEYGGHIWPGEVNLEGIVRRAVTE